MPKWSQISVDRFHVLFPTRCTHLSPAHAHTQNNVIFQFLQVPDVSGGEHKTLKGASRKMELCASSECGNFAVANESVKAGETLVAEQPIAACILPKFFGTHCLHCMKRYLRQRQMTVVRYMLRQRSFCQFFAS